MALVHDDDLKFIEGAIPPLETLRPDALMGFFRNYAPTIRQFQCGKYLAEAWLYRPRFDSYDEESPPGSSSNESKSVADVAIATVATLSQNLLEAPR